MIARRGDGRGKRGQAAEAPSLSRERIIAAAVELLDRDGVEGLTIRRLASHLDAGAMSLYWHVANKEAMLDLALDAVLAYRRPTPPVEAPAWRDEVVAMLDDWRAIMLRHPWSAALLPRRALGQSMLDRLEALGAALTDAGVAEGELNGAIWSLWNLVMGATVTRASFDRSVEDRASAPAGPAAGRHPTIERSRLLLDDDWDGAFRQGLDLLLDGLVQRRAPT